MIRPRGDGSTTRGWGLSGAHLGRVLRAYLAYYNTTRPHQSLDNNSGRWPGGMGLGGGHRRTLGLPYFFWRRLQRG
jgi:transposase InsO family protein